MNDTTDAAPCTDCGLDVMAAGEYGYMLVPEVWEASRGGEGFLCVGCLENRLGRRLTHRDFDPTIPLNFFPWADSPTLADRKRGLRRDDDDLADQIVAAYLRALLIKEGRP